MPFPVQASSCRTALCELALLEHSDKRDAGRIRRAVDLMFEHDEGVRETTKVFEDYFALGSLQDSYHYYFGHYYASQAFDHLPESEARRYAAMQSALILSQRELDGSFVDSQIQGKCTSTAFAVLTLLEDSRILGD